jgi:alpha-1,6-mannosyltransferase
MNQKIPTKFNLWYQISALTILVGTISLGYFLGDRSNINELWIYLTFMFVAYFIILKKYNTDEFTKLNNYLYLSSRLILLFSFPLLSDDIYRFIWDGSLILQGINPFSFTPKELMSMNFAWIDPVLFQKMNSPAYYSIYPPINQLAFLLSAIPGKGNLVASATLLRLFILTFDFGNIYLIKKLLIHFKKNENLVFLYALNPLVIIEFTGNLHFEAVMIFFTLLAIWYLLKDKWIYASLALSLAIGSKLLPLVFLPFFIRYIGWKKAIYAGLICGFTTIVLFLPFIYNLELAQHFIESIQLYYGKFEFNGSIYQILKAIGWKWLHYNPIAYTSKILLGLTLVGFLITYFKSSNIFEGIFWLMFIYTIFGAIVHPWYILILVAMSPFVKWRLGLVWSVLICLSYYTYRVFPYQESLTLIWVEYGLLLIYMIYELSAKKIFKKNPQTI